MSYMFKSSKVVNKTKFIWKSKAVRYQARNNLFIFRNILVIIVYLQCITKERIGKKINTTIEKFCTVFFNPVKYLRWTLSAKVLNKWKPVTIFAKSTAWKVSVFGVILVRIFTHLDWIWRDTEYFSVFSPNAGKCCPE